MIANFKQAELRAIGALSKDTCMHIGVSPLFQYAEVLMADYIMILTYWALTAWWVVIFSIAVAYIYRRRLYSSDVKTRPITTGFIWLASFFFIDSLYWSLASSARVGMFPRAVEINGLLYDSRLVSTVKTLFLFAGVMFLATVMRTYRQIERNIETLYFTRFVDQSIDAIGVLNSRGIVDYWNTGAERLYGRLRADVIGKHIKAFLVPTELHPDIEDTLRRIRVTQKPVRFQAPRLKSDNSKIDVDITITPFFHDDGTFGGFFGIMRPTIVSDDEKLNSASSLPFISNSQEMTKSEMVVRQIAKSALKEERDADRKQVVAGTFAIALLMAAVVLVLLALVGTEEYRFLFGSGAVLSLLIEIWTLRYLMRTSRDRFRARAIERLLELRDVDGDQLRVALEVMSSTRPSLSINMSPPTPSDARVNS